MYCTYLTIYRGNLLPPFYIGYSSLENIINGYRGSVSSKEYRSLWLNELKKNPHLFETRIISRHENKIDAMEREEKLQRRLNVVRNSLYINKTIGSYPSMTGKRHSYETKEKIRASNMGLKRSEEARERMKISNRGKVTPESRVKISNALKGLKRAPFTEEHRAKLRAAKLGKKRAPYQKRNSQLAVV